MEKFRDERGRLCNYELINHSIWLLRLYGSIINNKVDQFKTKKILEPLIEKLKKYSMNVDSVNVCAIFYLNYNLIIHHTYMCWFTLCSFSWTVQQNLYSLN